MPDKKKIKPADIPLPETYPDIQPEKELPAPEYPPELPGPQPDPPVQPDAPEYPRQPETSSWLNSKL